MSQLDDITSMQNLSNVVFFPEPYIISTVVHRKRWILNALHLYLDIA